MCTNSRRRHTQAGRVRGGGPKVHSKKGGVGGRRANVRTERRKSKQKRPRKQEEAKRDRGLYPPLLAHTTGEGTFSPHSPPLLLLHVLLLLLRCLLLQTAGMFTLLRPLSSSSSRRGPLSGRGVPCHLCIVCREVCVRACNRRLSRGRRRRRHPRRCATLSQLSELSDFLYAEFLTSCISALLHRRRRPGELMHARGEGEWRRKWRKWRKSHHRLLFAQRTYKWRALSCERGFFSFATLIPWRFSVHLSRSIAKVGSTVHNGGTPRLTPSTPSLSPSSS